ncbi:MAG: hypothetical protein HRF40_00610 [Nitrososphaera sp.]
MNQAVGISANVDNQKGYAKFDGATQHKSQVTQMKLQECDTIQECV